MGNEEFTSTLLGESTSVVNDETEASNADMEEQSYEDEEYTPRMSFGCAISTCLKKYCTFKGRARRSEFWWFELFCFVLVLVAAILFTTIFSDDMAGILTGVIVIAVLLPRISVAVRRLHDAGHSGTFLIVAWIASLIPLVGIIATIYLITRLCEDSEPYENKYGPSPKYPE